jgi:DNA-binding FadR family transcriptional regulator
MIPNARRRPPLVDEISREISERIRGGRYAVGQSLAPERELAGELGVSRPVVREAIQRLESQGLLDVRHGVGVLVVDRPYRPLAESLTLLLPEEHDRLRQLTQARLMLEPQAAGLAARCATVADLRALEEAQAGLRGCTEAGEAVDHDLSFHRLLARATGNQAVVLMLDALADLGRESRRITLANRGVRKAYEQHQVILAAVRHQDPAAAAESMRKHLRDAATDVEASATDLSGKARIHHIPEARRREANP